MNPSEETDRQATDGGAAQVQKVSTESLIKKAGAGYLDAMYELATQFHAGIELSTQETWLRKAAEAGHAGARDALALRTNAAAGNAGAMYEPWIHKHPGMNFTDRRRWLTRPAETGHIAAMHGLGTEYRRGAFTKHRDRSGGSAQRRLAIPTLCLIWRAWRRGSSIFFIRRNTLGRPRCGGSAPPTRAIRVRWRWSGTVTGTAKTAASLLTGGGVLATLGLSAP